jgi:hypothetical protein
VSAPRTSRPSASAEPVRGSRRPPGARRRGDGGDGARPAGGVLGVSERRRDALIRTVGGLRRRPPTPSGRSPVAGLRRPTARGRLRGMKRWI